MSAKVRFINRVVFVVNRWQWQKKEAVYGQQRVKQTLKSERPNTKLCSKQISVNY